MSRITIENTDMFCLVSIGNGAAYEFTHKPSGETKFIQYGDDATRFRDDYNSLETAYGNPKSVWYHVTWNTCLNELYETC